VYLVSIFTSGTFSQAASNEPDLPWGEGRFSPLFPKILGLLPAAYPPRAGRRPADGVRRPRPAARRG
jgi:hypothetical protein